MRKISSITSLHNLSTLNSIHTSFWSNCGVSGGYTVKGEYLTSYIVLTKLVIKTAVRSFTLAQWKLPSKDVAETTEEISNTRSISVVLK